MSWFVVSCSAPGGIYKPVAGQGAGAGQQEGAWARRRLGYTALTYQMPASPEVSRTEDENHDTERARLTLAGGQVLYMVESFSHESTALAGIDRLLTGATARMVQQRGGVVRSSVTVSVGGYPGADLVCDFPSMGVTAHLRMLVGRERAYSAFVAHPMMAGQALQGDIERFTRSLELDAGDAPESDGDGAISNTPQYVEPVGSYFALRMPGRPRRAETTLAMPDGAKPTAMYTVSGPDGESWEVAVTLFNDRPPTGTFGRVASALASSGWTIRQETATHIQGYTGRSYVLASTEPAREMHLRLYATEARLYAVRVTLPAARAAARAADVARYFDSLRIL